MKKNYIYLSPVDYDLAKTIESYPNPNVKDIMIDGIKYRANKACTIYYQRATENEIRYNNLETRSYILTSEDGFFPTNVIFGVNSVGRYYDVNLIGANVGSNLGTASVGVVDIDKAKELLIKNNFTLISK